MESFIGKRTSPHMYDQHSSDALRASSLNFRHSQLVSGYRLLMADIPRWGIPLVSIYTVTFIPRKRAVAEIVLVVKLKVKFV
ncbi:hypothetical protein HZB03_04865 [Candidatus Woesearchaeota archaeon]|nr:hypothetical protein [Candidatus Woesearchaeota archaeon]